MMRDSQNPELIGNQPLPTQDDELAREKAKPLSNSYYYDDATGYEIYHEGSEAEEERESVKDNHSKNEA